MEIEVVLHIVKVIERKVIRKVWRNGLGLMAQWTVGRIWRLVCVRTFGGPG